MKNKRQFFKICKYVRRGKQVLQSVLIFIKNYKLNIKIRNKIRLKYF